MSDQASNRSAQLERARVCDANMMQKVNDVVSAARKIIDSPPEVQALAMAPLLMTLPQDAADLLVNFAALRVFATDERVSPMLRESAKLTLDIVNTMIKGDSIEDLLRSKRDV